MKKITPIIVATSVVLLAGCSLITRPADYDPIDPLNNGATTWIQNVTTGNDTIVENTWENLVIDEEELIDILFTGENLTGTISGTGN